MSLLVCTFSQAQSILTVVGGGPDDGRPAISAGLAFPTAVVADPFGNLYIADIENHRIRKVDAATGLIATVAGNGTRGFAGEGGSATSAALNFPEDITISATGDLYVADSLNHRIRKVDAATQIITTVAGTGAAGFFGDGGLATTAALHVPSGIAVDSFGNLYIADEFNHRIRKVDATTRIITTVAGSETPGFSGDGGPATAAALSLPSSVAIDAAGNLYIADSSNHRIRKVDVTTRIITTVAGGGTAGFSGDGGLAVAASLNTPFGVAIDAVGNLYIADTNNERIRIVDGRSQIITTAAGRGEAGFSGDGGLALAASLNRPLGVAVDRLGNLYIADQLNHRVRKVDRSQIVTTVAGSGAPGFSGEGGPAPAATMNRPAGIAFDSSGNIYIADSFNHRVRKVDARTRAITTTAGTGQPGFSGDGGEATSATLNRPSGVALDADGNIYIADTHNNRIRIVDSRTQVITTFAGSGDVLELRDGVPATATALRNPFDVAVDTLGNLYIADTLGLTGSLHNRIRKVDAATRIITTVAGDGNTRYAGDGGPATAASLNIPLAVAIDASGNLYIADQLNNRIRRVDPSGVITTVAGTGTEGFSGDGGPARSAALNRPSGLAVDASGNLYIADTRNHRVRTIDRATQNITTIAGSSVPGFLGDGGPATAAGLSAPQKVAVDRSGKVLIADESNRIRAVFACVQVGLPSLSAPADGAIGVSTAPTLSWSSVPGAFRYDLILDRASSPTKIVASDLTTTSFTPSNLLSGTKYFWGVVAKGDPFCPVSKGSSGVRSFTTEVVCGPPASFTLTTPADGATTVETSALLSWQPSAGASSYDIYLGTSNPPAFFASTTATSLVTPPLVAGTTYFWNVTARAACDLTQMTVTPVRSFRIAGACQPAGSFTQLTPAPGSTNVPTTTTLRWSNSVNASGYDLYLGNTSPPAIYGSDLKATSLTVSGLIPGTRYSWRVVAAVACDPNRSVSTPVSDFTTQGLCPVPRATSITFTPPGNVGLNQTYVIAWADSQDLAPDGYYIIERSLNSSFSPILDSQQTASTSASFVSTLPGLYFHRVRPINPCNPSQPGPNSAVKSVNIIEAQTSVIFTVQPQAVITALGERLEDKKTTFTLENLGKDPIQVGVSGREIISPPFFTIVDPLGKLLFTLESRKPKTFEIRFSGPRNDVAQAYQGIVYVSAAGLPVIPYAFVSLKVGGGEAATPRFFFKGSPSEYAFFDGFAGDDSNRAPIMVLIQNPGSTPMELGAEIGPELWLDPKAGWNQDRIEPGASRAVQLSTDRNLAPPGSALPRYTYFTVRTKTGRTARLLVQDNDAPPVSLGRSAVDPSVRSHIVPEVLTGTSPGGKRLASIVRLSNSGSDSVQADLFLTPTDADGFDGARVKRATILVPRNDVVSLTDPLAQLFELTPPASGQLEVRAAPERIALLNVSSFITATTETGGTFGYQVPSLKRGEGARLGLTHAISGISASADVRTNLILVETTGIERTSVHVVLYDREGVRKGESLIAVPPYGQKKLENLVSSLGGGASLQAGRVELTVEGGGGSVAGLAIIVDAVTESAATLLSEPLSSGASVGSLRGMQQTIAKAYVLPTVINGPSGAAGSPLLQTVVGLSAAQTSSANFTLKFRDAVQGRPTVSRNVTVPGRRSIEYSNILEQLFGIAPGAKAQGSIFVDAEGQVYARLLSNPPGVSKANVVQTLPVVAIDSESLTSGSGSSRRPLYYDGLEQSTDPSRGTRWNLILTEVRGQPVTVMVRLYEAGNRTLPIAENDFSLAQFEQRRLETVFRAMGLDTDQRRKDRTNVLCVVSGKSGSGSVSALAESIDNRTGDIKTHQLAPAGGIPPSSKATLTVVGRPSRRRLVRGH